MIKDSCKYDGFERLTPKCLQLSNVMEIVRPTSHTLVDIKIGKKICVFFLHTLGVSSPTVRGVLNL